MAKRGEDLVAFGRARIAYLRHAPCEGLLAEFSELLSCVEEDDPNGRDYGRGAQALRELIDMVRRLCGRRKSSWSVAPRFARSSRSDDAQLAPVLARDGGTQAGRGRIRVAEQAPGAPADRRVCRGDVRFGATRKPPVLRRSAVLRLVAPARGGSVVLGKPLTPPPSRRTTPRRQRCLIVGRPRTRHPRRRPPRRGRRGGYRSSMPQNRRRPARARHLGGEVGVRRRLDLDARGRLVERRGLIGREPPVAGTGGGDGAAASSDDSPRPCSRRRAPCNRRACPAPACRDESEFPAAARTAARPHRRRSSSAAARSCTTAAP